MYEKSAVVQALENEKARLEALEFVRQIRRMGGTQTILTLAGYILTAEAEEKARENRNRQTA